MGRLGMCLVMWGMVMSGVVAIRGERFRERLVVRPLADGSVLGHFDFESELGETQRHHRLFPKAVLQMMRGLGIQELELAFTQGRWEQRRWGAGLGEKKPGGVELRAQFHPGLNSDAADALWRNVTHALSGLFCASINFLENTAMVAKYGGSVRRGALPREAVCTENLTPWLKLLPCRDQAGLATLLKRTQIHNGAYYSLRVHVVTADDDALRLSQTLTVVLNPPDKKNWSLSSLFGRTLIGSCPLATSSHVILELEPHLVQSSDVNLIPEVKSPRDVLSSELDVNLSDDIFSVTSSPDLVSTRSEASGLRSFLLNYDVRARPLDVGMSWKGAFRPWAAIQGPFRATQFLTGRGNGRSSIVSMVNANRGVGDERLHHPVDVTLFQIVPWYVRLYMHTLKVVVVDGDRVPVRLKLSPAEDRKSPAVVEIGFTVLGNVSQVMVSVDFDKGYLRIDEHPPDANRGFDLPAALFTFASSGSGISRDAFQVYSENLLVLLATPDFSMPYNVITFTMTALALYFGSLLNSLRLRSVTDEEAQLNKQPSSRISSMVKSLLARLRRTEKVKTL